MVGIMFRTQPPDSFIRNPYVFLQFAFNSYHAPCAEADMAMSVAHVSPVPDLFIIDVSLWYLFAFVGAVPS